MSYKNLKRIEKELEDHAYEELRVQESMNCAPDCRYAFLFRTVVKKSAAKINALKNVNNKETENQGDKDGI